MLEYWRPAWVEPTAPCYMGILHQDAHLLVVHKPAGLQVLFVTSIGLSTRVFALHAFRRGSSAIAARLLAPARLIYPAQQRTV